MKLTRVIVLAALLATACGPYRYTYAPVTTTSGEIEGESAARVFLQDHAAPGELRIATFGVANGALNLRYVVVNSTDDVWTFDPAAQKVEISDAALRILPPASPPPPVEIAPHSVKTVDLAVPIGAREAGDIGRFVVLWNLRAGAVELCGRVPFVRHLDRRSPPPAFTPAPSPPFRVPDRIPDRLPTPLEGDVAE